MDENNTFNYTYSAKEQEEVRMIREKYLPEKEDKMKLLRKLDAGVSAKATAYSLIAGIVGTLVMGTGMSLCMVWGGGYFVWGIIIGVIGIALMCTAYPIYTKTLRIEKEKIAPVIISLTDELLK